MFLKLQWNSLERALFEVHESQCDVRIPNFTVWQVLQKCLQLKAYKLSIVQDLTDADKVVHKEFCTQMFHWIQDDERFLDSIIFNDESTFNVSAGSGQAKIHVSSWNMFVPTQR
jgi:hypothetical protein